MDKVIRIRKEELDCGLVVGVLTRPDLEDDTPNIDWLIDVFTGTKKDDGKPDSIIKSLEQPVGSLKYLLKKIFNIKGNWCYATTVGQAD